MRIVNKLSRAMRNTWRAILSGGTRRNLTSDVQTTQGGKSQPAVKHDEDHEQALALPDQPVNHEFYGEHMQWIHDRRVRISKPSKNVMQSGTAYTNQWRLEFNCEKRYQNELMGWTSSADPMSNTVIFFPSKEDAIQYCEANKINWFVEEQPERQVRRKSYAENFSWNKRTRLGNK